MNHGMSLRGGVVGACLWIGLLGGDLAGQLIDLTGARPGGAVKAAPKVEARLTAGAQPEEAMLSIHVTLAPGSYTTSTTSPAGGRTKIVVQPQAGLEALGEFEADHAPKVEFDPVFNAEVEKFAGEVTWRQRFRVLPGAGTHLTLQGTLQYQVCNASECTPYRTPFTAEWKRAADPGGAQPVERRPAAGPVFVTEAQPGRGKGARPLAVRIELVPPAAKQGETVSLQVTAVLARPWHLYATTQPPDNAAEATVIDVLEHAGLEPIEAAFTPDRPPEAVRKQVGDAEVYHELYHDRVVWSRKFRVTAESLAQVRLAGEFRVQYCDASRCISPPVWKFALPAAETETPPVRAAEIAAAPQPPSNPEARNPEVAAVPETPGGTGPIWFTEEGAGGVSAEGGAGSDLRSGGLWSFLITAGLAGFAALLTPCVFPMVPITVSFFLKQSERQHHRPYRMALVYCLAIVGSFTFLGLVMSFLFGATYINTLANGIGFNLFMSAVLVFFALNLLGMFEIHVPGWLLSFTAGKESAGGYLGLLFMALTFTLTSFTCTFAFLGVVLVWSAQGEFWWPTLGLVAFATAFASPFFFLALFPTVLKKLPRAGGWMNRIKVVMGLVELALVFKFLSVVDIVWNSEPLLFDYHFVMSAWMVIAVTAGLYLLGLFRLPHDVPADHVGVVPLVCAMSFLGLGSYLAVGLFGSEEPQGVLWENIAAFAPPSAEFGEDDAGLYLLGEHDGLKYHLDFDRALQHARKQNQPLFLDFTGVNCINCRLMERHLAAPHNQQRLQQLLRLQLYTDTVPHVADGPELERLLARNRSLQENFYGDATLPAYAVLAPDGRTILATFAGLEQQDGEFARFLDQGLRRWRLWKARQGTTAEVQPAPLPSG